MLGADFDARTPTIYIAVELSLNFFLFVYDSVVQVQVPGNYFKATSNVYPLVF